jgi:hypothetical protein
LNERLQIGFSELELVSYALKMLNSDSGSHFVALGDPNGMNASLKKTLSLFEKSTSHDNNSGSSITNFIVLTSGKLNHELGNLVVNVHLLQDGGAVVGDGDVAVRALKHFVHAFRAERGTEDASDGFAGGDVSFLSIETSQSTLLLLLLEDNEGPSELVESQSHFFNAITILLSLSETLNRFSVGDWRNNAVSRKALTSPS